MATNMKTLNGYGFDASALGGHDPSYYATSEDIQQVRREIPTELPNPNALTINGQSYDGSAAVNVTITGGDGGANIDDTTPSSTTTYSSQKIESELRALNEAKANNSDLAAVAKSGSYTDLTNKPTIPTVPSSLPNPNALTFTGAVNETYDGSAAKSVAIPTVPESLKNPNKLTFTGAVTAEYDGSAPVSVEIPAGGSVSYTLPVASPTTLGGVQPAAKTDEMTQAVGVDDVGGLWTVAVGASGGKTLTKIVDLTIEEYSSFTITADLDGNALSEESIVLFVDVPTNSDGNHDVGLCVNGKIIDGYGLAYRDGKNYCFMHHITICEDYIWTYAVQCKSGFNVNGTDVTTKTRVCAGHGTGNRIQRLTTNNGGMPAGTKIKIYAWR